MTKYIIVKIDSETKMKSFLKGEANEFKWTNDIDEANVYCEYYWAVDNWYYAVRFYNPNGDRIIIQIYDKNQPPWE